VASKDLSGTSDTVYKGWGKSNLMHKMQILSAELKRCQDELHFLGMEAIPQKKLIISTGDLSDVDGFFALAQYAKTGADVLFIMNYPAYVGVSPRESSEMCDTGLGYRFNVKTYVDAQIQKKQGVWPNTEYKEILQNIEADESGVARYMDHLDNLAFSIVCDVWRNTTAANKGKIFFCIGGINEINPFACAPTKSELEIYIDFMPEQYVIKGQKEGSWFDSDGVIRDRSGLNSFVLGYDAIFMDFNGSMAFFNQQWKTIILDCAKAKKLGGVFVQGGVYSDTEPLTIPAIPNVLNRVSCATMNQLYSPTKTATFFDAMKDADVKIYVAANNETFDLKETGVPDSWRTFVHANGFHSAYLERLGHAYYKNERKYKIFDSYTALALVKRVEANRINTFKKSKLFYNSVYGISILGKQTADWSSTRSSFIDKLPADPDGKYKNEIEILRRVSCAFVDVFILRFSLSDGLLLSLVNDPSVLLGGEYIPVEWKDEFKQVDQSTVDMIENMKGFKDWGIHFDFKKPKYNIKKLIIQDIDMFGPRIGFLKMRLVVTDASTDTEVPGIIFMRGASVAILMVLSCHENGKKYSILTVQPRLPVGKSAFHEIPAGMLDDEKNFAGAAAKEIKEETSMEVKAGDLVDLLDPSTSGFNHELLYLSPGGCDEGMKFYLYEKSMSLAEIQALEGKCTGCIGEGESIKLAIKPLDEVINHCPDAKTITALHLYNLYKSKQESGIERSYYATILQVRNLANALLVQEREGRPNPRVQEYAEVVSKNKALLIYLKTPGARMDGTTENETRVLQKWAENHI